MQVQAIKIRTFHDKSGFLYEKSSLFLDDNMWPPVHAGGLFSVSSVWSHTGHKSTRSLLAMQWLPAYCLHYLPYAGMILQGQTQSLLMGEFPWRIKEHLQKDAGLGAKSFKPLSGNEDWLLWLLPNPSRWKLIDKDSWPWLGILLAYSQA